MERDVKVLLSLLRIALHQEKGKIDSDVNWQKVNRFAVNQGVRGIAFEGLEFLTRNNALENLPNKDILLKWFAQSSFVEQRYKQHKEQAVEFTMLLKKYGIKTIVFKGLAHSRYYTKPDYREFGDFDCYLIDEHGFPAYGKGNRIAKENGYLVDDSWYKHSKISFKNLNIENHRYITSARRGGTDELLNCYLVKSIGNGSKLKKLVGTDIYVLPIEAEGLFMLYHSLGHFLVENINFRHFIDWACWLDTNQSKIQWTNFYAQCKLFRLDGFVDVMNTIAVKYLGVELYDKTVFSDSPYAERMIESTLYGDSSKQNHNRGLWCERFRVIKNAFKHYWKYRDIAHYSMIGYMWQFVYGLIRKKEED